MISSSLVRWNHWESISSVSIGIRAADPPTATMTDDTQGEFRRLEGMIQDLAEQIRQFAASSAMAIAEVKQSLALGTSEVKQSLTLGIPEVLVSGKKELKSDGCSLVSDVLKSASSAHKEFYHIFKVSGLSKCTTEQAVFEDKHEGGREVHGFVDFEKNHDHIRKAAVIVEKAEDDVDDEDEFHWTLENDASTYQVRPNVVLIGTDVAHADPNSVHKEVDYASMPSDTGLCDGDAMEVDGQDNGAKDLEMVEEEEESVGKLKTESCRGVDEAVYQLPPIAENEFRASDLVWGKVRSHSWWPGQMFDPSDAAKMAMKYHKKDSFLVAYFGDHTFAWNEAPFLKPFRSYFSNVMRHSNTEEFQNAVNCAMEEVSRRAELVLACSCLSKDVVDEIKVQVIKIMGNRHYSRTIESVDKFAEANSFKPYELLRYVKSLAQSPFSGADRLELVIAEAQLLAKYRHKGFYHFPEFQSFKDLAEDDAEALDTKDGIQASDVKEGMATSVLLVQFLRIGNLVILCVPGEFTTMAGRRLRDAVKTIVISGGDGQFNGDVHVVIAGLSNTYSQYIITLEEYKVFNTVGSNEGGKGSTSSRHDHRILDQMLATSIAAEEGESSMYNASISTAHVFSEDYENDSDEEMIVLELYEAVDKEVLNSLPISVHLDLFTHIKERDDRKQTKISVPKEGSRKFSKLQIQSFLKAVALRRGIHQVQKASVGRGVGGVQTSRIASETNGEFIFSSSYVGNKERLTSSDQSNNKGNEPQTHSDKSSSNGISGVRPKESSSQVTGFFSGKRKGAFDDSVQTFLDERGHIHVSRVRTMGIHMTRDLQRNLDLMKEIGPQPPDLLDKQISLLTPVVMDATTTGFKFDAVKIEVPRNAMFKIGDIVLFVFWFACRRNDLMTEGTFSLVELQGKDTWVDDFCLRFKWSRSSKLNTWSRATTVVVLIQYKLSLPSMNLQCAFHVPCIQANAMWGEVLTRWGHASAEEANLEILLGSPEAFSRISVRK